MDEKKPVRKPPHPTPTDRRREPDGRAEINRRLGRDMIEQARRSQRRKT